ncbi:MAG: RecQ family ATP-dependent DNA helicase [Zetaproteobacteria bacterium]|nr:RecQ family ATP-dependent DNA helicase [Zetaproteobacteria bacterium]
MSTRGEAFSCLSGALIIAEKPIVAEAIANALGGFRHQGQYYESESILLSWTKGHVASFPLPNQLSARYRSWDLSHLPIVPTGWQPVAKKSAQAQIALLQRLAARPEIQHLVCATDAAREGELIFRFLYQLSGWTHPVQRFWTASLTPKAICTAFTQMKPSTAFDDLYQSAVARAQADWLVGINFSRGCTSLLGERFPVGRVQTPTLSLVAQRDRKIREFKEEKYRELKVVCSTEEERQAANLMCLDLPVKDSAAQFVGWLLRAASLRTKCPDLGMSWFKDWSQTRRYTDSRQELALQLRQFCDQDLYVLYCKKEQVHLKPPLLPDLVTIQKYANRFFGYTAQQTLDVMQALYERHKVISYPRTDCRYLASDDLDTFRESLVALRKLFPLYVSKLDFAHWERQRYVSDAQATDHHAIVPTGKLLTSSELGEKRLFDLVCRLSLATFLEPYVREHRYLVVGAQPLSTWVGLSHETVTLSLGWKSCLADLHKTTATDKETKYPLQDVAVGQPVWVVAGRVRTGATVPPQAFSDATLLSCMEMGGASEEVSRESRPRCGIGTAATRAGVLESLIGGGYLCREGKKITSTAKAEELLQCVPPQLQDCSLTKDWEESLEDISLGRKDKKEFLQNVVHFVTTGTEILTQLQKAPQIAGADNSFEENILHMAGDEQRQDVAVTQESVTQAEQVGDLHATLARVFAMKDFRPGQEEIAREVVAGRNGLVIMPTGSGKSLCYLLPGYVRQGPVLVISPLISLIEDQVLKLTKLNLNAFSVHSGLSSAEQNEIARKYCAGEVDFLYFAPERLRSPYFVRLLQRQQPSLIAIDEAHCVSEWGHDFRVDYRYLGQRLACFVGVPRMAVTATAAPAVKHDIVEQLVLGTEYAEVIRGFWRGNLAIQVATLESYRRVAAASRFLEKQAHLPAIIYVARKADAEDIARQLAPRFRAACYHGGMDREVRRKVLNAFLAHEIEVVVATIAFGMGVDKANVRAVIHMTLPDSLASYYQQIGRAGRDGLLAQTVLFYSESDLQFRRIMFAQTYPELSKLRRGLQCVQKKPLEWLDFCERLTEMKLDGFADRFVHWGAVECVQQPDGVWWVKSCADASWEERYLERRKIKNLEIEQMYGFCFNTSDCRMAQLIRYFGDDGKQACGHCDVCAGHERLDKILVPHQRPDAQMTRIILQSVIRKGFWSRGKLLAEVQKKVDITPADFDLALEYLAHQGKILVESASFEKAGRTQYYLKICPARSHTPYRRKGVLKKSSVWN